MTNQFRTTGLKISANQTCEQLLREIKKSNLNFYISESPFAVTINLKKSFIKQKDGSVRDSKLISEHQLVDQIHRNIEVEELSKNLFETKKGLHETYNKIKMKSDEFEVQINEKKRELLIAENKFLELDTKLKEITPNLEKQSEKLKILEDDKMNPSRNDLNANIVTINESEAEENRQLGHNASTSFDTVANSANSFSISSSKSVSSSNSKTLTSRGFVFSPTPQNKSNPMADCSHTPQCTIRQPFPRPSQPSPTWSTLPPCTTRRCRRARSMGTLTNAAWLWSTRGTAVRAASGSSVMVIYMAILILIFGTTDSTNEVIHVWAMWQHVRAQRI